MICHLESSSENLHHPLATFFDCAPLIFNNFGQYIDSKSLFLNKTPPINKLGKKDSKMTGLLLYNYQHQCVSELYISNYKEGPLFIFLQISRLLYLVFNHLKLLCVLDASLVPNPITGSRPMCNPCDSDVP